MPTQHDHLTYIKWPLHHRIGDVTTPFEEKAVSNEVSLFLGGVLGLIKPNTLSEQSGGMQESRQGPYTKLEVCDDTEPADDTASGDQVTPGVANVEKGVKMFAGLPEKPEAKNDISVDLWTHNGQVVVATPAGFLKGKSPSIGI